MRAEGRDVSRTLSGEVRRAASSRVRKAVGT